MPYDNSRELRVFPRGELSRIWLEKSVNQGSFDAETDAKVSKARPPVKHLGHCSSDASPFALGPLGRKLSSEATVGLQPSPNGPRDFRKALRNRILYKVGRGEEGGSNSVAMRELGIHYPETRWPLHALKVEAGVGIGQKFEPLKEDFAGFCWSIKHYPAVLWN